MSKVELNPKYTEAVATLLNQCPYFSLLSVEIMGHKTERMAMSYQHPMPSHKLEAVKTLDKVPPLFPPQEKEKRKIVHLSG